MPSKLHCTAVIHSVDGSRFTALCKSGFGAGHVHGPSDRSAAFSESA